jgi:plasmid stabilization system protein ParE
MDLRWTEDAASDLERIADYLFDNAPARAADLAREISSARLSKHRRGHPRYPYLAWWAKLA